MVTEGGVVMVELDEDVVALPGRVVADGGEVVPVPQVQAESRLA